MISHKCDDDRKNKYDGCFLLANNMISWDNKEQLNVTLSPGEAKHIFVEGNDKKLQWINQMIKVYNLGQDDMSLF